jgi:cell division protein FtsQ
MRDPEGLEYRPHERQPVPKRMFSGVLMLLVLLIAGFLFLNSSFFTVTSIVAQGNKYMSSDEIYAVASLPQHSNIFRLNVGDVKERLSRDLRVAQVSVSRQFPNTIVINITERKPLAYIASSYGFVELDKQGVVLAAYKNIKKIRVPMITGVRLDAAYVSDQINNQAVLYVLSYLANLDEETLDQLSEINVADGKLNAYTNNSIQIRIGAVDKLMEKAKLTQDMLKEIKEHNLAVDYVDLNYSSPIIKFKQ